MPVRWNTTFAETERAILLWPICTVINAWVEQMEQSLSGQKKAAATRKKKKLYLSPQDWEKLIIICDVLTVLNELTHFLSKSSIPTISMVLPFYKYLQMHLKKYQVSLRFACQKALEKLDVYMTAAVESKYVLLGAVLHPFTRIKYFENTSLWALRIPTHAHVLLAELYKEYVNEANISDKQKDNTSVGIGQKLSTIFGTAVTAGRTLQNLVGVGHIWQI
ncbi:hypothetical protein C8Q78DRAFT_1072348 [Trametes maxima]|nr:hypothetical protein C8Q78DRAFT_1072348 [Trametes maxima]